MRYVVDAGRTIEADALPACEHFGAVAAFAQAGIRRLCGGEKAAGCRQSAARRRLRNGVGVPAPACDSPKDRVGAIARGRGAAFAAIGGLLKRAAACGGRAIGVKL